jgi:hypothetical protein
MKFGGKKVKISKLATFCVPMEMESKYLQPDLLCPILIW